MPWTFQTTPSTLCGAAKVENTCPTKKYVQEMARVLKPGGKMVIATWCQRDNSTQSFTAEEEKSLDFFVQRVDAPVFHLHQGLRRLVEWQRHESCGDGRLVEKYHRVLAHSIWVGVFDPRPVVPGRARGGGACATGFVSKGCTGPSTGAWPTA